MKGLLEQFLSEAGDLLEQVDAGLLELERDPGNRARLDEVFRAAHTLKGSSGLFDLPQLTRLTHAAEDLLDAVRGDRLALTPEMADDLLAAFDLVRRWLDVVAKTETLPPDAATEGAALSVRLRAPLGGEPAAVHVPQPRPDAGTAGQPLPPAPQWVLDDLGAPELEKVRDWLVHARTTARVLRLVPDEQCFFRGEDPLRLIATIPAIEAMGITSREAWAGMDQFDEYQCLLVFSVVTRASLAELEYLCRYVPDEVWIAEVDADGLSRLLDPSLGPAPTAGTGDASEGAGSGAPEPPIISAARSVVQAQLRVLRVPLPAGQAQARIASAGAVARLGLTELGSSADRLDELSVVLARALEQGMPNDLAELIERELGVPAADPQQLAAADLLADGDLPAGELPGEPPAADDLPAGARDRRTGSGDRRAPGDEAEQDLPRTTPRVLKVDQATVDRLLDLVGELVVAKNALPFLATAAEEDWNARALGRQIKDQYGVVTRISEELQTAVMDVRMLPMSAAYARFPRMIRDLSRSLGKEVVLHQEGQDTAADKDVIEMLGDPMVHLIRNSLDHGIEPPQERIAAGKPAQATILLRAVQEPDAVVIDIVDDGRGIDPDNIRRKAYARGLITEDQLATVSDQDAVNLVFLPGFSTAEQISDVSGRGVGMDAVRASVEAAGGTVRLMSTPGQGSTVRLRVPLSMAVSRVMIVTVGGVRFGVPVDLVIETVRLPRTRISRVGQQDVIVLRDTVVPLAALVQILRMTPADADDEADADVVSVLVTRVDGHEVGLVVDAFHEGAEVIVKPMEGIVAGTREFCGTALMGDGSVLLVLDVKEVLSHGADAV